MLTIKNLNKKFNNKKVLDTITLSIPKGSVTIFLGESGVGKSTLLRVLSSLETADSGHITINDQELNRDSQLKDHVVGMVFQQFNLFSHKTVKQNITLPLEKVLKKSKAEAEVLADSLLKRFNLQDLAQKSVEVLSGGQKQRLALARTLAMNPSIICMDEPTSALDPLLTSYVAQIISDLATQGYIVVVATHDTVLIEKINCMVYLMKDGKIIESAPSTLLKQQPEAYPYIKNFIAGQAY